jgi:nitrate reductase cytochrome c-type subunit
MPDKKNTFFILAGLSILSLTVIGFINGSGSYSNSAQVSRDDETNETINNMQLERDRAYDRQFQSQPPVNP